MGKQDGSMAALLNGIPGLHVKEVYKKDREFIVELQYLAGKYEKTYNLVAGKNGLRFELNSYNTR